MRSPTMAILTHDLPEPEMLDLGSDAFDTQTLVTVVCGSVTGELDRVVSLDADGGRPIVLYETRIDGLPDGAGIARVECDSATELANLAAVAGYLSRELARLHGRGPLYTLAGRARSSHRDVLDRLDRGTSIGTAIELLAKAALGHISPHGEKSVINSTT